MADSTSLLSLVRASVPGGDVCHRRLSCFGTTLGLGVLDRDKRGEEERQIQSFIALRDGWPPLIDVPDHQITGASLE